MARILIDPINKDLSDPGVDLHTVQLYGEGTIEAVQP
jgi:hypothetical protein